MVLESRNHHERKTNETSKFLSTAFFFFLLVRFLTVSNTFTSLVHDILNKRIFPVCYWCKLFKWVISMLPQASILKRGEVQSHWHKMYLLFSCKWNSFSQERFCSWPRFESESFELGNGLFPWHFLITKDWECHLLI